MADVELVRRQKIESEERLMAEMDEARARADDEKCAVVSCESHSNSNGSSHCTSCLEWGGIDLLDLAE